MNPFSTEPALSAGFVMALITVAVTFGAPISPEQQAALQQNLPVILAGIGALVVWIRQMVTPTAKVEELESIAFNEGWDTRGEAESLARGGSPRA
jgi:hypothetical protein